MLGGRDNSELTKPPKQNNGGPKKSKFVEMPDQPGRGYFLSKVIEKGRERVHNIEASKVEKRHRAPRPAKGRRGGGTITRGGRKKNEREKYVHEENSSQRNWRKTGYPDKSDWRKLK